MKQKLLNKKMKNKSLQSTIAYFFHGARKKEIKKFEIIQKIKKKFKIKNYQLEEILK